MTILGPPLMLALLAAGQAGAEPLPDGATTRLGTALLRLPGKAAGLHLAAGGKTLVTVTEQGVAQVWELPRGRELARFRTTARPYFASALTPDGRILAVDAQNGDVLLYDTATGKELRRLVGHKPFVGGLAFSPDGRLLVSGDIGPQARLWDVATGKTLRTFEGHTIAALSAPFTADGKAILLIGRDSVAGGRLFETATGKELRHFPSVSRMALAFSPDGATVAASDHFVTYVGLWEAATGKYLRSFAYHNGGPRCIRFAPGGKLLATGDDWLRRVRLWDIASEKEVARFDGVRCEFTPDGKTLIVAGTGRSVTLYDLATHEPLPSPAGHRDRIAALAFTSDSKTVATASDDGTLRLWDAATGEQVRQVGVLAVTALAFAPREPTLAIAGRRGVELWDTSGRRASRMLVPAPTAHRSIAEVAFAPDGESLGAAVLSPSAFGGSYGFLEIWGVATGKKLHARRIPAVALAPAPDLRTFAWCSEDGEVGLAETLRGPAGRRTGRFVRAALPWGYSADGRTFAHRNGDSIVIKEVVTGQQFAAILAPDCWTLALSPDGRLLAEGRKSGEVVLRDAVAGAVLRAFQGPPGEVMGAVFSPDGRRLATWGQESFALLWDVALPVKAKPLAAGEAERLWQALSGTAAESAAAGSRLREAPAEAATLLRERVRAVAPGRVGVLLADLDSKQFAARERATQELRELGREIAPALRAAAGADVSLEKRRRIERVLSEAEAGPVSPTVLRTLRAVALLEQLGTAEEGRAALRALAAGAPEALRTQEARLALTRLGGRASP